MKHIFIMLLATAFVGCGTTRVVTIKDNDRNYNPPQNTSNTQTGHTSTSTTGSPEVDNSPINTTNKVAIYVHKYKAIAQYEMQQTGIPSSITLAQGILESGAGESRLAKQAKNHFGIKCHGWTGGKIYHNDDKQGECFRKYTQASESFKDHSKFLTSRSRYASLFKLDGKDYKGWARGLRKAGYATDSKYPSKLINLIERYELYKYDTATPVNTSGQSTNTGNAYKVVKGDTLYSIARKFNISVDQLMTMNNLSGTALTIGQQLIVK